MSQRSISVYIDMYTCMCSNTLIGVIVVLHRILSHLPFSPAADFTRAGARTAGKLCYRSPSNDCEGARLHFPEISLPRWQRLSPSEGWYSFSLLARFPDTAATKAPPSSRQTREAKTSPGPPLVAVGSQNFILAESRNNVFPLGGRFFIFEKKKT